MLAKIKTWLAFAGVLIVAGAVLVFAGRRAAFNEIAANAARNKVKSIEKRSEIDESVRAETDLVKRLRDVGGLR